MTEADTSARWQELLVHALAVESATTPAAFVDAIAASVKAFPLLADELSQHAKDPLGRAVARYIHALHWQITAGHVRLVQAPAAVMQFPAAGIMQLPRRGPDDGTAAA